jgi:CheY-like chemotaxis protein
MGLTGKVILVVEDSPLVAATAEEILSELGCVVLGPSGTMANALPLCEHGRFDAALIDLNIRGTKVFPLLKILVQRQIPFVLVTGYADWSMPDELAHARRMQKPYDLNMVRQSLLSIFCEQS